MSAQAVSVNDALREQMQLGRALGLQYQNTTDVNDLQAAVRKFQDVVVMSPADHPHRAGHLQGLAVFLTERYRRLGDLNDLEGALQRYQEAVDLTAVDHPDRAGRLEGLAASLRDRAWILGDQKDLEAALEKDQEAVDLTPAAHPERAGRLQSLAASFMDQYQLLGSLNDLKAALQRGQEAVDLTPAHHPRRAERLQNLAVAFKEQYRRLGDLKDLEVALLLDQEAVDLIPLDHPNRAGCLQSLARSLRDRHQRLGDLNDLETAMQKSQEAVDLTPEDHPERAGCLQNLAATLTDRYQRLGDLGDLETALERDQEALDLTPVGHPLRPQCLQSFATSLRHQYQKLGDLQDLEQALQKFQESVDLTPLDHPDRPKLLQSLAAAFTDRYRRLGNMKDLEAALQKDQEAVDLTPTDHPDRAQYLQGHAMSLTGRYQRFGDLHDLEESLQKFQEAVDLAPVNHPQRPRRLQSLAMSYASRYRRLGDPKDLRAALQNDQEAVKLTTGDDPERAGRLQSLGVSFNDLYQRSRELTELEAALQALKKAVTLTPIGHPDRPQFLQSLAMLFRARYQELGDLHDLEEAFQKSQEAVDLTLVDHPDRPSRLQSLAIALSDQYERFRKPEYLKAAHEHYRDSFKTQAPFDPEPSWKAALGWASFAREFQPSFCAAAYNAAFNLLPEILWLGHTIPVRQDAIRRLNVGSTASAATRTCVQLSDLSSAVQFIEQGLATTFQQMLQLKTDVEKLPSKQAKIFHELSFQLYSGTAIDPKRSARERSELLEVIRKQPGHEYFLLPQPYKVLCQASLGGPVVILNSHEDGCDGIIIPSPTAAPVHVALPNVTLALLNSQKILLKKLLGRCSVRAREHSASTRLFGHREEFTSQTVEECFKNLLDWLWTNVVDTIYQALGSHGIHNGRLWWLLTGSFTGLPLHASPPTDQFIHSYAATLGSLLEAQARKPPSSIMHTVGVVGVTHTRTGNWQYLPGVEQEVNNICSVVQSHKLECLRGEQATPEAVKHQLQNCSWVHLACHGTQDLLVPTKSRLLLYDGVLELDTILRMPLSNAEFVFLAACQTAMGDAELVNESFHLGGGFIAAGFRGAIGTLWSMNDLDGPVVAESVYSHLFGNGRQPEASDAAEALHLAVRKLKAQNVPYERWIPFIHIGV